MKGERGGGRKREERGEGDERGKREGGGGRGEGERRGERRGKGCELVPAWWPECRLSWGRGLCVRV